MNQQTQTENIYNAHWYGPFATDCLEEVPATCVLYMLTGTHGQYGRNVPLYIGKTERNISTRIAEHEKSWLRNEPDPVSVYAAEIGSFTNWEQNWQMEEYVPLESTIICAVESLLIYAHQPVYNSRSKLSADDLARVARVFNTGRRSTLLPEVSGKYYFWDPQ